MKVVDGADEIYKELGEPADLSVATIAYWLRNKVGQLNNLIFQNFRVNSSYEIDRQDPDDETTYIEIGIDEMAILKKMYMVYYYENKTRSTLGAASTDSIIEVSSDGDRVRMVNKNELSKTYISMKKSEQEELMQLVHSYKIGQANPIQVAGDDTIEGSFPTIENLDYNRLN